MSHRAPESQVPPFLPALVLLVCFAVVLALLLPAPPPQPKIAAALPTASPTLAATLPPTATATSTAAQQTTVYDPAVVAQGQAVFESVCFACHGPDAKGIPGLGKNLIASSFVHGLTDEQLLQFISKGRDTSDPMNTTGVAMPPRGGNPSLTDDQLRAVIAFIRTQTIIDNPAQTAPTTAPAVATAAPLQATVLPTRIPVTPQAFTAQSAYAWSCAGCHGADGKGNGVFGPSIASSTLLTDRAALLAFLTNGNPLADPRTAFAHPARGGYPQLTDEQLAALTDYVIRLVKGA
ncbi:MAG TPA: c-type cytochrome [Phototrophicaceae bacterium]|nr:c-type cytochrome [Phototrophicaceae bacterium]